MNRQPTPGPEKRLESYIQAKDANRPHLMAQVFSPAAVLEMQVKTENITFPAETRGQPAIADLLSSRFGQTYENVYTFCLARPPADALRFECDWLVGMSAKADSQVRVGCGAYLWSFEASSGLVERLLIRIEHMSVFSPALGAVLLDWLAARPYPWCRAEELGATAPTHR